MYRPDWLARHDGKTHYVGVISRFEGAPLATPSPSRPTTGLLLAGAGGSTAPADALDQLRRGAPDFRWVAAGGDAGWVEELWPLLSGAGVVVTHAGQSAIADVAAASVAAVVIPQHRPFGEQHSTAAALADAGVVATAPVWPRPDEWAPLITTARARSTGDQWRRLQGAGAAARRRGDRRVTTALVTVAHGRHDHLRRQSAGLERSRVRPDLRVVVAIDDPGMAGVVDGSAEVIDCATTTSGLPWRGPGTSARSTRCGAARTW